LRIADGIPQFIRSMIEKRFSTPAWFQSTNKHILKRTAKMSCRGLDACRGFDVDTHTVVNGILNIDMGI